MLKNMSEKTHQKTPKIPPIQLVNIDWLSFSVTLALSEMEKIRGHADLQTPEGLTMIECKSGTPQYKRRVIVQTDGGSKLMTLLLEPYANIINPASMFVEVANQYLYQPIGLDWLLPLIEQIHPYSFRSLSRYDMACDFNPDRHQMAVIKGLHDNRLYAQGKREGAMFYDYQRGVRTAKLSREPRQLAWGSKASSVKWKLYNKTLEVYEQDDQGRRWANKPHIVRAWEQAGINPNHVWRLECSLTGASSYDWRGEKLSYQMFDRLLGEEWLYDMVETRFTIRRNEGHQDRSNDTIIELITIPDTDHYRTRQRIGSGEVRHVDYAATLRACIKELERPEVAFNPSMRDLWLRTTNETIELGRLQQYFFRTFGMAWEEYAASVGTEQQIINQ